MKFRTKILLAIWGVVLALLLVSYVVINYWIRVQVVSRFSEDLKSNYSAVRELETLRAGEIVRSCQIIAESPRMKAIVELGDRKTAEMLCQELNQSMKSDLFLLTDSRGRAMVELLENRSVMVAPESFPSFSRALRGEASADVWGDANGGYRCASVPITIGPDRIGTLTLGFKIRQDDIRSVQSMTNSEVILLVDTQAVAFTLADAHLSDIIDAALHDTAVKVRSSAVQVAPFVMTLQTKVGRFAGTWCRLDHGGSDAKVPVGLLLLKPVEAEVRGILAPVLRTFAVLSLIVLVLTAGIGFLISEGITRPIAELVKGTAEVSRGNYDYRIAVGGGGELHYLAEKFGDMSQSLKDKITQLEATLKKLKETQRELVKSERLAATGKLTAQLAHEINNPIHNIQSCFQMVLKRIGPGGSDRELLEVGYEEVERLAKLTRQMLDVYRTSMVPIEREPADLNQVIQEVVHSSLPVLNEQAVAVVLELSTRLPLMLGSRDKLKQVLLNLILNARDAMPGGGTLTIGSGHDRERVQVTVADTGSGILPEHVDHIFDAFFTTKSNVSGVGLGLSVTYGIVKQHDGTITVETTPGKGTCFTLSFPLIESEETYGSQR